MSEEQNSRLYNENNDYGERDYAPRKPGKKKKRKESGGHVGRRILQVLGTLLLVGLCTGAIVCCFAAVYIKTVIIPEAGAVDLSQFAVGENSVMYYMDQDTGNYRELVTLAAEENAEWVNYEDIPEDLINATVAIEDRRFWEHNGVDWKRTAAAILYMFTGQDIQGGSTITQQLIKNLTQYDDVTVKRKVIEIFRALQFDKDYTKETTLEWYLNFIWLGDRCRGVGAAAMNYFGKPVQELTLAECASLISITNNPTIYGPYSDAVFTNSETGEQKTARDKNKERQELVLWSMLDQGYITQEEYDEAVAQELVFDRAAGESTPSTIYSWYEEQVISDVKDDLKAQYGYSDEAVSLLLTRGGLSIYTCVDPDVQAQVEQIYSDRTNLDYTSSSGQQLQSAITVIDNETGNLVGIAGRVGEKTGNLWMNFATDSKRQPGSSIKPLSVYAPAFEMGLISPISVLDDYPHEVMGGRPWPVNVDGRYRGLVTVRQALSNSYNTVSVRVLADLVTPENSFNFVEEHFHLDLEDGVEIGGQMKSDIGVAPLSMGGLTYGVNTRDMAEAFAVFPNGGLYQKSRTYTKVTREVDGVETVLLENQPESEAVLKSETAYYVNSILREVVTRVNTSGNFDSGMAIAGKTGTTDDKYDRWFVGYTPYYTAAVWVGFEQNERVPASGNPALKMWTLVMSGVHEGLEDRKFSEPAGLTTVTYCLDSGLLATDYCRMDPRGDRTARGTVFQGDAPTEFCTSHTAETTVTVCLDCPILDGNGEETGLYHLAGEFCPEESRQEVSLLGYQREDVGGASAEDAKYFLGVTQEAGPCTVHTAAQPDPDLPFDPNQPWDPSDPWNPNTNPLDPTGQGGGGAADPGQEDPDAPQGGETEDPSGTDPIINPETGRPYGY